MRMIIIEGCDGSGKTTLLNQLIRSRKMAMARSMGKPQNMSDITRYHTWAQSCPQQLVLDRHPGVSDLIYGPIIRGNTPASLPMALHFTKGHYLIYCRPCDKVIHQSAQVEQQMNGVNEHLPELIYAYDDLMATLEPQFVYDFTNPQHYGALLDDIARQLD